MIKYVFLLVVISMHWEIRAQFADSLRIEQDTMIATSNTAAKKDGFFRLFTGKPGKAALYSLVFPGGGQIYNRRYWKVPLVYAAEGTAIYFIVRNGRDYREFRDAYVAILNGDIDSHRGLTNPADIRLFRDKFRKNMETSYIVLVVAHLLSVIEAFVDRHLIDFDIDENLAWSPPALKTYDQANALTLFRIGIPIGASVKYRSVKPSTPQSLF